LSANLCDSAGMATRFSVFIAVSVDGYIARQDGALDWLARVELPGEDYGYAQFMASVDTLVLGRGTYDTVLGFDDWPYDGKQVIVVTNRPAAAAHGERFFAGDVSELAAELSNAGARRVYVDGGNLIRQFLAADLLSDLTLSIIPVVLGGGIPLFSGLPQERGLKLSSSQNFSSGLVQIRYDVQRAASRAQPGN
jgi:dihydrofolate reductase